MASDGEDVCFVNLSVRDAQGLVVPRACTPVAFAVEGPGEIVATDNGDEADMGDFRQPRRNAFNGWAQAIVRARKGTAGKLRVTASADGLETVAAEIAVRRAE